ncbi:D-alanine--poly(phosphoribitol) ligase subunit DltA [Liquorilactobacillus sicerae]|uniref:D-alanine--poly(phosphoribitol) ligase subunit DltA n=1 Tax=Liquorilactobacillus sicerae TaxID=1416943 RepID=UPI00247FCC80|nr:D-alanine--poly(phosphoribitol) ligase subunit DltA [Liquorilactobacillus sicerae]
MTKTLVTKLINALQINDQNIVYTEQQKNHTYHELKAKVFRFADFLTTNYPNSRPILVFGDHQFEMIVTFLGCVLTGHPYIPVDSASGIERIKSILTTADPQAILLISDFPFTQTYLGNRPLINRQQLQQIFQQPESTFQPKRIAEQTPFYILFTSGTTGSPKGVPISHANLNLFLEWLLSPTFSIPEKANFLGQVPYSFDVSNMYWLPAILRGGTIKALFHQEVENFASLFQRLPQLDLDVFVGTPSLAEMLLLSQDFCQAKMPHLKLFLLCGEELTVKLATKLTKRFPQSRIFNTYGPTEATVAVSAWQVQPEKISTVKRLPLGTAEPQVKLLVCDDHQLPVPTGQPGEIIISGPCVSAGYLNNPQKTKAAFFTLNDQPAYHTGDLGYFDQAGLLNYLGRKDFQIKLHGFRIELDEVRAALEQSSLIKQAVAIPKYGSDRRPSHLVGLIIPTDSTADHQSLIKQIRQDLAGKIMPYMLPSQFIFQRSFPLSPNGKIDVKRLIKEVNS